MTNTLFSTYSLAENQVTSSILAVFERLSFALVESILQVLCAEPELSLLTFDNQVVSADSIPDGRIRASFVYWIETKIIPNTVNLDQITRHLRALDMDNKAEWQRLLVLTPDPELPASLKQVEDQRIIWTNFDNLVAAIQEVVKQDEEWLKFNGVIPNEYERGLLRELVRFLYSMNLVGRYTDQVLVVPARAKLALEEYLKCSVYICQPGRTFQPCSHLAFYITGKGIIYPKVPKILEQIDNISKEELEIRIDLTEETRIKLRELINNVEQAGSRVWNGKQKIIFLSPPDSPDTIKLPHEIKTDTKANGRTIAFAQGHRYIPLSLLKKAPETTSKLVPELIP